MWQRAHPCFLRHQFSAAIVCFQYKNAAQGLDLALFCQNKRCVSLNGRGPRSGSDLEVTIVQDDDEDSVDMSLLAEPIPLKDLLGAK